MLQMRQASVWRQCLQLSLPLRALSGLSQQNSCHNSGLPQTFTTLFWACHQAVLQFQPKPLQVSAAAALLVGVPCFDLMYGLTQYCFRSGSCLLCSVCSLASKTCEINAAVQHLLLRRHKHDSYLKPLPLEVNAPCSLYNI